MIAIWLLLAPFALGFAHLKTVRWSSIGVGVTMLLGALAGGIIIGSRWSAGEEPIE